MATLSKTLKDNNGNTILPKTRANWVYCEDNITVENKLSNIPTINPASIIYNCTCTKSGTVFSLTNNNIPIDPSNNLIHASFIASADYLLGDTFKINNQPYSSFMTNMETLPEGIFKHGALVSFDINTTTKLCFFKLGGNIEPPIPEEPPEEKTSYSISQAFTTDTSWIVPEDNWYRIICVGKSGDGGHGGEGRGSTQGAYGGDGAGGNAGGISASTLFLKKDTTIQITVNTTITSFGSDLSATVGGTGGIGGSISGERGNAAGGLISSQYGDAYGGNKANITGLRGYNGYRIFGSIGDPPNPETTFAKGGYGGYYKSDVEWINQYLISDSELAHYIQPYSYRNTDQTIGNCVTWFNLHVILSGAGGGGKGGGFPSRDGQYSSSRGGYGQPGVCIIEKAVK